MIRSFHQRLVLLSCLLTGLTLAAFGTGAWWQLREQRLHRLDTDVLGIAEREAMRQRPAEEWSHVESDTAGALGLQRSEHLLMWARASDGRTLYRSPHWPAGIDSSSLIWPARPAPPPLAEPDAAALPLGAQDATAPPLQAHPSTLPASGATPSMPAAPGPQAITPKGPTPDSPADTTSPAHSPRPAAPSTWQEPNPAPPPGLDRPMAPRSDDSVTTPPGRPAWRERPERPLRPHGPRPGVHPRPEHPAEAPGWSLWPQALAQSPPAFLPPPPRPVTQTSTRDDGQQVWHLAMARSVQGDVLVGLSEQAVAAEMRGTRNALLAATPIALLLAAVTGWLFAARSLRPLRALAATAQRVTARGLDQRIPAAGADQEFVELINVFNRMLERLERSFHQASRFSADAAHELKTPLAIMQGQLERALQAAGDDTVLQAQLASVLDEVQRLSTISRKLLLLAQADAGQLRLQREAIDLTAMLGELAEDAQVLDGQLALSCEVAPGLRVDGDRALLWQVLHNLLSNALKYRQPADGWVRIEARAQGALVELRIANASDGLSKEVLEHLFERFYRASDSRNRRVDGTGLGLSVSREIARALGGELRLAPQRQGEVCFVLMLPKAGGLRPN